jgi:branched-chain amino acid transport system substrate-binding protein
VKIGSNFEQSGQLSAFGVASNEGVGLAVKEINAKGGFAVGSACYKIGLVTQDNHSDGATAVAQVRGLVKDNGVRYIFGPASGNNAVLTQAVTQGTNPPALEFSGGSLWETNGLLAKPATRGLFRTAVSTKTVEIDFARGIRAAYPKAKTIYLVFTDDATTASLVAGGLLQSVQAVGFKVVGFDKYPPTTTDFSAELSRVKAANPDVVYIGYIPTNDITITRQAVQLGIRTPIAAWQGQVAMALKGAIGKPIPMPFDALYDGVQMDNPLLPATKAYTTRFAAAFGAPNGSSFFSLWYYDEVYMLVKAMQLANNTTNTDAVRAKLLPIRWNGAAGPTCWSSDQNVLTGIDTGLVNNGKVAWTHLPLAQASCRSQG